MFLHELTLARYMDLLEASADPEVRDCLRARLLDMESRLGSRSERLQRAEAFIAKLHTRIRQHEQRIADLARNGGPTDLAERLRQTAIETLQLFEAHRQALLQTFDAARP